MSTITKHDLQDLRRRVLVDRRNVEEGALDGEDALGGVVEHLDYLIDKLIGQTPAGAAIDAAVAAWRNSDEHAHADGLDAEGLDPFERTAER